MFLPSNITLQFGDSGDFVSELQRRLAMVQCFSEDQVNGFFDGNTVNGVTRFQGMVGLHADGVAGPETLRRLNGVISGGTTAPRDEEKKPDEVQPVAKMAELYGHQPPAPENPAVFGTRGAEPQPQPQYTVQPFEPPAATTPSPEQQQAEVRAREAELQQQQQKDHARHSALADMLLAPKPAPSVEQQAEVARSQQQPAAPLEPLQQLQQQPAHTPQVPEKAEPKTMIGRALKFASAYMQKLSDYFHNKLAPSTLDEVHEIGLTMRQHGVKEAPIPMGPEMARAPQAGRETPQVQQQTQRG